DREKMIRVIDWTMLGFAEENLNKVGSIEDVSPEILREADEYFALLKKCFYKKGEEEDVY
ncbi:MAG TPA: TetR/AcrR family transcriptional regulator, partial [Peptococcaceae bacterium]|nr:TetR/AcrR family transcriptional regulator [Peptococcaceae bacterium]